MRLPHSTEWLHMNSDSSIDSNPVMPILVFFGALTLLLIMLVTRPVDRASAQPMIVLDPAAVSAGRTTFLTICASCHSPSATGIKGLGKPLIGSEFFNSRDNDQMVAFLQVGRPVNDPLNTTGVTMPARGGRLTLTDNDLLNVITYIRSLNPPYNQRQDFRR